MQQRKRKLLGIVLSDNELNRLDLIFDLMYYRSKEWKDIDFKFLIFLDNSFILNHPMTAYKDPQNTYIEVFKYFMER